MARFLARHRDRVAKMTSPAIATLCDRWLTNTPPELANGFAMPYRREFAELALASAREMQLIHAKGIMCLGDGEMGLYQATFAGAPDLPADVAEWALEMARRRPERADIVEQVRAYRIEQTKEHKERLRSDEEYRKRHERRQNLPTPIGFSGRKLPPWPLGATGRVEGRFREAVLRPAGFQALMRTVPAAAGEVLLACIIEDEPRQEVINGRALTPTIERPLCSSQHHAPTERFHPRGSESDGASNRLLDRLPQTPPGRMIEVLIVAELMIIR